MANNVKLDRRFDWVGPPDPLSKIRSIRLRRVDNETNLERDYRLARESLNEWNSDFWRRHNQEFERCKSEFVAKKKETLGKLTQVSAEEMSVFYRDFLNQRRSELANYNSEWYRRNFSLIWPALKVNLIRVRRLILRR
ncbi:unnamed protein product [Bursaphelenchus xylophilus]|uniref:(pine wood nematode) hypothetical protein n=1 Tax=Bursaphelenchus xylophilus TaxID=6326 RepID=A0A1I7RT67_BURXY|nr:unnamed protein product [Bursaphelenchus xylophilus]CAG9122574.1 unnamed protein product [Bursaphelenchus xylophilus]